jgi:ribonuclease-3
VLHPAKEALMPAPAALAKRLGHAFAEPNLLAQALTHRSHGGSDNERLEFLGDSVLNCVVSILLFQRFERVDEGTLSRLRSGLVRQDSLAALALTLGLSEHVRLGEGELKSGGFRRPSILADTLEAMIGAVYLDAGFDVAFSVVRRLLLAQLESIDPRADARDAKTLLQETLQAQKHALPTYRVAGTQGAAHEQQFQVICEIAALAITATGEGTSRRAAEQVAAQLALEMLADQRARKNSTAAGQGEK